MSFRDELDAEIDAARRDLSRQLNTYFPLPPAPPLPRHVRAWRAVRYEARERTRPVRRWVARRLYDFEAHEDRW